MNMMKYCPECYKELPPNSTTCPFCGYRIAADEEQSPSKVLQTPKVDAYIPPEQTVLGLLLLIIFFWGINVTIAALPIYFSAGTKQNLLIAAIASQVITRALIGIWAVEEISLKKDARLNSKLGAFFLAFIPIGDIFSSLHAARTSVRKNRLPVLSTASIFAVIMMALVLYGTSEEITDLINGVDINATPTPIPTMSAEVVSEEHTATPPPTPTTRAYINGCRNPLSVSASEEGDTIQVCGKITNFGIIECPTCPHGFYSFVKLSSKFQIVSYEWRFTYVWLGKCVGIKDTVELLGDSPVFVYAKSEGCSGDECITDSEGGLTDDSGVYFQPFDGCD